MAWAQRTKLGENSRKRIKQCRGNWLPQEAFTTQEENHVKISVYLTPVLYKNNEDTTADNTRINQQKKERRQLVLSRIYSWLQTSDQRKKRFSQKAKKKKKKGWGGVGGGGGGQMSVQ